MSPLDPASIQSAAALFAAAAVGATAEEAGRRAWQGLERLVELIRGKLKTDRQGRAVLDLVDASPQGDEISRQALAGLLADRVERDPEFAFELKRLVDEAHEHQRITDVSDSGAVANRDVNITGFFAAGRDIRLDRGGTA